MRIEVLMNQDNEPPGEAAELEGRYANYFKVGHNAFEFLLDFGQLAREDERVERDISPQAAAVELAHQLRQFARNEIFGPRAGVEAAGQAEIDRVRAVFDCRANALAVARRGEQLGTSAIGSLAHWASLQS